MQRVWNQLCLAGVLLLLVVGLSSWQARGDDFFTVNERPLADGTNYSVFIVHLVFTNADGVGSQIIQPLLAITNINGNQSFTVIAETNLEEIFTFEAIFPPSFYGVMDYTLIYTNYSTKFELDVNPLFVTQPDSQEAFAGNTMTLTAQAYHYASFQWQKDGTNLVEDGHFIGVTNATLTISNACPADTGDYIAYASDPSNTVPSIDAYVSVFKPFQIALSAVVTNGAYELTMSNQDGSAMDPNEVSHIVVNSTTDLTVGEGNWNTESATGGITNGVYQVIYPWDGSAAKCYQVGLLP